MFASVFVIVWCGAALVTVNAALLGGKISFFQSVCVLGYCICPLNVASFVCHFWANQVRAGRVRERGVSVRPPGLLAFGAVRLPRTSVSVFLSYIHCAFRSRAEPPCLFLFSEQVFQLIVVSVCFLWSTRASVGFMAELVQEDRRALAVYPLVLFYLAIGWLILVQ